MSAATSSALVQEIRGALRSRKDPTYAAGAQRYMKSEMPYLGVRMPEVRRLSRAAARRHPPTDAAALERAVRALWDDADFREERYAAQALLRSPLVTGNLRLLPLHERIVRTGAWWDHVDEAARHAGDLLDAHQAPMTERVRAWSTDQDMWLRRVSIIGQLRRRERTDTDLLGAVIEANLDDGEFFIRKAIGWALRQHARTDPDWVRAFVAAHPALSPLSRREALKHLSAGPPASGDRGPLPPATVIVR